MIRPEVLWEVEDRSQYCRLAAKASRVSDNKWSSDLRGISAIANPHIPEFLWFNLNFFNNFLFFQNMEPALASHKHWHTSTAYKMSGLESHQRLLVKLLHLKKLSALRPIQASQFLSKCKSSRESCDDLHIPYSLSKYRCFELGCSLRQSIHDCTFAVLQTMRCQDSV